MAKKKQLTEGEALLIALRDHPQWRRQWEDGTLPDEIPGPDGQPMSPRLHIMTHVIVERQLAADDPKGVVAIAEELARLGVSQHDIRHEIGLVITNQIWRICKQGHAFDERQYLAQLRKIVAAHRG